MTTLYNFNIATTGIKRGTKKRKPKLGGGMRPMPGKNPLLQAIVSITLWIKQLNFFYLWSIFYLTIFMHKKFQRLVKAKTHVKHQFTHRRTLKLMELL